MLRLTPNSLILLALLVALSWSAYSESLDLQLDTFAGEHPLYKGTRYGAHEWDEDYLKKGVEIIPERQFHWIFDKGDPIKLTVKVAAQPPGTKAVFTIVDWAKRVKVYKELPVPVSQQFEIIQDHFGLYLLIVDLVDNDTVISRLVRSFAVTPNNETLRDAWRINKSDFFLGSTIDARKVFHSFERGNDDRRWPANNYGPYMHADLGTWQNAFDLQARLDKRIGMTMYRAYSRSQAKFSGMLEILGSRHGFDLLIKTPARLSQSETPSYAEKFVRPQYVRLVEVGNEPDNDVFSDQPICAYVKRIKWMKEAVEPLDPTVCVMAGGFTPPRDGSKITPDDASEIVEAGRTMEIIKQSAHMTPWISWHGHGSLQRVKRHLYGLKKAIESVGTDHVLVQTEGGELSMNLDDEFKLGYTIIQKIAWSWAFEPKTKGWIYYSSNHFAGPRFYPPRKKWNASGQGWGLVDYFFCPRWPYATLAGFARVLAGAEDGEILLDKDGKHLIVFKRGRDKLVVVFDTKRGSTISFTHDGEVATSIDHFGNELQATADRAVRTKASQWPQYYLLRNACHVKLG